MAKPVILNEEPITMANLKEELKSIKERDKELNFRANKFVELDAKKADELKKKLEGLKISRLKPEMITKIIDLLPKTVDKLKVILQGYVITIGKEDSKKIVKVVNDFAPAK